MLHQSPDAAARDVGHELPRPSTKIVYLVRHAESMENVRARAADHAWSRMMSCRAPSCGEVQDSVALLCTGLDAPLSPVGEQQLLDVAEQLDAARFITSSGVELVVHSSRERARRTAHDLFAHSGLPFISLEDIVERTPFECMHPKPFRERLQRFCQWLSARPETRLVVVGHGQFFRQLQMRAGPPDVFRNVEIRRCNYDASTFTMDHGVRLFLPGRSRHSLGAQAAADPAPEL